MKELTQEEKLDYLVKELCNASKQYKDLHVEKSDRRIVMRSLMNVRIPSSISSEFIQIQDEFLQQEAFEKGIVRLEDVQTMNEQYGSDYIYGDKISIWQGDITRLAVDAIVNAANSQMLGCFVPLHKCIDNAIHSAAGIQLREECNQYMQRKRKQQYNYEEPTGSAVVTNGYNLPCKYVIHTVGPIVAYKLTEALKEDLHSCYRSCLSAALEKGIRSIAFCCISTGEFHFPNEEAADIAVEEFEKTLRDFSDKIDRIIINVFKDTDCEIYEELLVKHNRL